MSKYLLKQCLSNQNLTQKRVWYAFTKFTTKTMKSARKAETHCFKIITPLLPLWYLILTKMTPLFTHLNFLIAIKYDKKQIYIRTAHVQNQQFTQALEIYMSSVWYAHDILHIRRFIIKLRLSVQAKHMVRNHQDGYPYLNLS